MVWVGWIVARIIIDKFILCVNFKSYNEKSENEWTRSCSYNLSMDLRSTLDAELNVKKRAHEDSGKSVSTLIYEQVALALSLLTTDRFARSHSS